MAIILGRQVRALLRKNDVKVIAVAGSIGKTSTKLAISEVLSEKFKVRYQVGNYNDLVSVPLVFFDEMLPSLLNPFAWLAIFLRNSKQLKKTYPYKIAVIELGTDGPGQIAQFKKYINADIGVLTSITSEHLEFFESVDNVAKEELVLSELSDQLIFNSDLCADKYINKLENSVSYGLNEANLQITGISHNGLIASFKANYEGNPVLATTIVPGLEAQLYTVAAAISVGLQLGMNTEQIKQGIANIKPHSGRMQVLRGVSGSTIIDDTYNASPAAVKAVLRDVYTLKADQKIAILGNMNELGDSSKTAHEEIGNLCEPTELDLVVTIGPDANKYLAPAAVKRGCEVKEFNSPYDAGEYVKSILKPGALILAKGSQNRVYAEEAVKILLASSDDAAKLVRQSTEWLKVKRQAFGQ